MSRTNISSEGNHKINIAGYLSFHGTTGVIEKTPIDGEKTQIPIGKFGCIILNDDHHKAGGMTDYLYFFSRVQKNGNPIKVFKKNRKGKTEVPTTLIGEGVWGKDLKTSLHPIGVRHVKIIYVMHKGEIWALELKGAASFAYGALSKKLGAERYNGVLTYTEVTQEKKGSVEYVVPVFKMIPQSRYPSKVFEDADKADIRLTEDLKLYFADQDSYQDQDDRSMDNPTPQLDENGSVVNGQYLGPEDMEDGFEKANEHIKSEQERLLKETNDQAPPADDEDDLPF